MSSSSDAIIRIANTQGNVNASNLIIANSSLLNSPALYIESTLGEVTLNNLTLS